MRGSRGDHVAKAAPAAPAGGRPRRRALSTRSRGFSFALSSIGVARGGGPPKRAGGAGARRASGVAGPRARGGRGGGGGRAPGAAGGRASPRTSSCCRGSGRLLPRQEARAPLGGRGRRGAAETREGGGQLGALATPGELPGPPRAKYQPGDGCHVVEQLWVTSPPLAGPNPLGAERGGPGARAGGEGGVAAAPARRTELQKPTGFFSFFGLASLVARLNLSYPITSDDRLGGFGRGPGSRRRDGDRGRGRQVVVLTHARM